MSCSKAKRSAPGPASEVYDGPSFRILRKANQAGIRPDAYVISAKHGLLAQTAPIVPYDHKLGRDLDGAYVKALRESLGRLPWSSYDRVFTFLGPAYERAVGDIGQHFAPGAVRERASGAIGLRLQALKQWLWSLPSEGAA